MNENQSDVLARRNDEFFRAIFVFGDFPVIERFARKVQILENGCWQWMGARGSNGYGTFWFRGMVTGCHRVSYIMANGEIPFGLELDHLCSNPSCVNPKHLEPVTSIENQLRASCNPAVNKFKTHCKNGHEFTAGNIYSRNPNGNGGRECRACWKDRQNSDKVREYKRLWAQKSRLQKKSQLPPS